MDLRKQILAAGALSIAAVAALLWIWFDRSPVTTDTPAPLEISPRLTETEPQQLGSQSQPGPGAGSLPEPISPPPQTQAPKGIVSETPAPGIQLQAVSKPQAIGESQPPPTTPQPVASRAEGPGTQRSSIVPESQELAPASPQSPVVQEPTSSPTEKLTAPIEPEKPQVARKGPPQRPGEETRPASQPTRGFQEARLPRRPAQLGLYETTTLATARSAPSDSAAVVDRIQPGRILHVTGSVGDWLEVRSKGKNITAYVRRGEAMYRASQTLPDASSSVPESGWKDVESKIQGLLSEDGLTGVTVSFIGDTAYLKGVVKTEEQRRRAELAARSIPEVGHITNWIRVARDWKPF